MDEMGGSEFLGGGVLSRIVTKKEKMVIGEEEVDVLVLGTENPLEVGDACLYHGAAEPVSVDPVFDYWNDESSRGDGGVTLGTGLYTTDDERQADNYARVRRGGGGPGSVSKIIPFEARMLDLRKDGIIPEVIFVKWVDYWKDCYGKISRRYKQSDLSSEVKYQFPDIQLVVEAFLDLADRYTNMLNFIKKEVDLDKKTRHIRYMLGSMKIPEHNVRQTSSPPQMIYFSDFMKSLGFDGVIANEGGDDKDFAEEGAASFVFFNLEKVGTRDDWQSRLIEGS